MCPSSYLAMPDSPQQSLLAALVELLSDSSLGLLQVALVADVIAADARLNEWMAVEGKRSLSDEAMLEALDVYEDTRIRCIQAIERFVSSADLAGLEAALVPSLDALRQLCRQ